MDGLSRLDKLKGIVPQLILRRRRRFPPPLPWYIEAFRPMGFSKSNWLRGSHRKIRLPAYFKLLRVKG
jgi:hypothetical protein